MNESKARLVVEIDTSNAKRNTEEVGKALNELSSKGDKAASTMVEMSKDVKTTAAANSQLKTEVDKSTKALSQNTEVSKRNSNALRELAIHTRNTLLASTALAGGVGGLTTVLGQAATDIDRYSKLTQMSTDEFQYFALGAAKAGYSMDSYAMALKDVYDRLGDVTDAQSGEMMDFFTNIAPKVGLTSEAFKDLSGQEALQLYYNSLKQLNLPHAEMVKYMEQLINDGTLLIPLLENNGAGFKKYGDEAQRAGAIMSGELINGLNEVNANLNSVKIEALGFANTITGHALPAVKLITANLDTLANVGGVIAALYGGRVAAAFALSAQKTAWNTAALVAQTSATNAATVAARGLYTALGGPVGLVVSLATVAAGYLMMRDSTEAANDAMEANARYSAMATSELIKLEGAQKRAAQGELADSVDDLSTKLKVAQNDFKSLVEEIYSQNKSSKEAQRIWAELTTNVIDADEALSRLNKLGFITPQQINSLTDGKNKIDAANQELKQAKIAFDAVGNAASGSVGKINDNTNALQGNENAARNAANALSEYAKQAIDAGKKAKITNALVAKGYSQNLASDLADIAIQNNGKVTSGDAAAAIFKNQQIEKLNATLETQRKQQQDTTKSSKSYESQLKSSSKETANATDLLREYGAEFARIENDLSREVARIESSNLGSVDKSKMIDEAKQISEARKKLYLLEYEQSVDSWKWSEETKLQKSLEISKQQLIATKGMTDAERQVRTNSLTDQSNYELALIKLAQETRIFYMKQALMTESEAIREQYRLEMEELAQIGDEKERQALRSAKSAQFIQGGIQVVDQSYEINSKGKSNVELLEAETGRELALLEQRFQAAQQAHRDNANELLEIERTYIEAKEQLHKQHDVALVDAREADHNNQMQFYGQMLSSAGAVWGDMTQMIKDAKGENSKTFKAMFIAQRTMAIAQQIINTELAAGATTAQTGIFGLPAAQVIRGIGYASVGLIAAQTLAGFSGGGFTGYGGKYEPAGIVHKGEGVLNQEEIRAIGGEAGFNQLRQAIKSGYSTGGLVKDNQRVGSRVVNSINTNSATVVQPKVTINNYSSEKVETSTNQDGELMVTIGKMLDQKIDTGVDRGIQRNLRQGYPLANAIKGR